MEKINIAYIIPSLDIGGSEKKVIELASNLDKDKFRPIIITITKEGRLSETAKDLGVPVLCTNKKSKFDIFVIKRIRKILKAEKIDIVQVFTQTAKLWGRLASNKQIVISTEESLFRNSFLDRFFEKLFKKKTNLIICNSKSTLESALSKTKLEKSKYEVIYNGIDVNPFIPNKKKTNNSIINLATVARLDQRKDLPTLFKALKILKEEGFIFIYNLAGLGPEEESLRRLSKEYQLDEHINFLGFLDNVNEFLNKQDIFILPSKEEGFGNAVIEAYAAKVAVITSNAGGLKEIVKDKETGLLFNVGDYKELANLLKELIQNKSHREELVKNGFKEKDQYTIDIMVNKHEDVYLTLMGGKY